MLLPGLKAIGDLPLAVRRLATPLQFGRLYSCQIPGDFEKYSANLHFNFDKTTFQKVK